MDWMDYMDWMDPVEGVRQKLKSFMELIIGAGSGGKM
jgi:hypothetical protein